MLRIEDRPLKSRCEALILNELALVHGVSASARRHSLHCGHCTGRL